MSNYWFNRQELLQKQMIDCEGKEKAAKYYLENEEALRKNARNRYNIYIVKRRIRSKKRVWKKQIQNDKR